MKFIVHEKNGKYIAYSSEYDFATQGDSIGLAVEAFQQGVMGMVCLASHFDMNPFDHLDPCPEEVMARNDSCVLKGEVNIPDDINYHLEWD